MTKHAKYLLCALLLAALAGCSDDSDVYYTTVYDITGLEISVKAQYTGSTGEPDGPGEPGGAEEGPGNPGDAEEEPGTPGGAEEDSDVSGDAEESGEAELIGLITGDARANAPVQPGGSYRLDFTEHDGGRLKVAKGPEAEMLAGTFLKQPGSSTIRFRYGAGEQPGEEYDCTVGRYTDPETGAERTMLTVDLTEHYRELFGQSHPDFEIRQVLRHEYTAQPYR